MSDPNTAGSGSTGTQSPSSGPAAGSSSSSGPAGDWREQRRTEREARRAAWREGRHMGWGGFPIGGLIVLAVGLIFLADNFGFHLPHNWWAILILIPAVGLLVTAIRFYRTESSISGRAMGPAIGGVVLVALALALFFGLNWGLFWPLILIAVGVGIMARSYWR